MRETLSKYKEIKKLILQFYFYNIISIFIFIPDISF